MQTTVTDYCRKHVDSRRYGSVNITARRWKCKRVRDSRRSPLYGVKYDPLFHFRHNGRDGTATVGHEINKDKPRWCARALSLRLSSL